MGGLEELGMGARFEFVFSCRLCGARSNHFQTARQTDSSFPLIHGVSAGYFTRQFVRLNGEGEQK
jgi:hypothetical protein